MKTKILIILSFLLVFQIAEARRNKEVVQEPDSVRIDTTAAKDLGINFDTETDSLIVEERPEETYVPVVYTPKT